jgi:hypothetical protein
LHAIYRISFGIGGPGYAVPFALLAAGISIPAFRRSGRCSQLVRNPKRSPPSAHPLTRFPGFVWIIAAGFTVGKRQKGGFSRHSSS